MIVNLFNNVFWITYKDLKNRYFIHAAFYL